MVNLSLNFQGEKEKLLLLDANALLHRAYYALPKLTDEEGRIVNAVYGFFSCLFKIWREQNPQIIIAVFDSPGKTFRHQAYSQYKATRVKAPDDYYAQLPLVKEILQLLAIPVFEKKGYEADDLIGTIAKKAEAQSLKTLILTGDFDLLQLVNNQVNVLLLKRGVSQMMLYNEERTREKLEGLAPEKVLDFKGLAGDSSDNLPGVAGIGPKTAFRLLRKFGSLENIYQALESGVEGIEANIKTKLQAGKEKAFLSKELATLKIEIPLDLSLAKEGQKSYNKEEVQEALEKLGFKSLLSRLP